MKCNLFYNIETNESVTIPEIYNKETVIEKLGRDFHHVSEVEIPCYDEEDAYYLYTFTGDFYRDRLVLHLKNKKFYDAAVFTNGLGGEVGKFIHLRTLDGFQYRYEKLCREYEHRTKYVQKITKQEGEKWIEKIKMMKEFFNHI